MSTATAPRFVIGIDLGTTNCAMAWAELAEVEASGRPEVRPFEIPQLVADAEVAARPTLPSFLYVPGTDERAAGHLALPWLPRPERVAGLWARDHGALLPGRLVTSAKSWLCHDDVDRRARILPWDADPNERACSPVEAAAALLEHLREAWNHVMATGADDRRLERQPIVLTVPASFDEEARELTVEAARRARFEDLTLQEEPTAALYAWLATHQDALRGHLRAGDTVLVCDVGGGTTDFTLVSVTAAGDDLAFERVAVGDHLLLGGDNVDLALARLVESRLGGPPLTVRQRLALRRRCAEAKEHLASAPEETRVPISVLGAGRAVVGGVQSAELTTADVRQVLLEGFLPMVAADECPRRDARHGLRELGLPFEPDPAITRHLAAFLAEADRTGGRSRPDVVLFNGGFFTPGLARDRVVEVLRQWFAGRAGTWVPRVLANASPATAVAQGAACYGLVRRGVGVRIGGGSPRAYYVGLQAGGDTAAGSGSAVCVLTRGTEAGTRRQLANRAFEVLANRPRAFSLWSSRARHDALGDIVAIETGDAHRHAPLVAELRFGRRSRSATLPVNLEVYYTELGTLEVWLASQTTDHRWRLSFELRGAAGPAPDARSAGQTAPHAQALVSEAAVEAGVSLIADVFGAGTRPDSPSQDQLPSLLEAALGLGRNAWPLSALRPLADALLQHADGRRQAPRHEGRWLNLLGFCMRPGFGATLDEWRMSQARRISLAGLSHPGDVQCQAEWFVLWQRLAGGLTAGQQQDLFHRHAPVLLGSVARKGKRLAPQVERESWRLLASLERVPQRTRETLGGQLLARLAQQPDNGSLWWALGRVGARVPTYGPLDTVVSPAVAAAWLERVLAWDLTTTDALTAITDIVALTGDAGRDLDAGLRARVEEALRRSDLPAAAELAGRLHEVVAVSRTDLQRRYGEALPEGLAVVASA